MAPIRDSSRPRVLHICEYVLARSETFVQQRLVGDQFPCVIAGWERVSGGLEVPCPSVILPRRVPIERAGPSFVARATRRLARPIELTRQTIDLMSLIVRSAPALVHAHFGTIGISVYRACELLNVPLVVSFYGYDVGWLPRQRGTMSAYARMFANAAALTAEGPALARALVGLGAPREAVKLLPLGFPASLLSEPLPERAAGATFELLQVARFVEKKGIDVTLRSLALARAAGVDARLVLIGDGPLRAAIESLIDELGVRGAVTLPGFVAHDELPKYLGRAHALVQPSRTAADGDTEGGHPTILLEAQARGVPVLGTTHADIPLVVRHGSSGLLCAEGDHEALARHIVRLAGEPETLAAMGAAARKMTLRRHDPKVLLSLRERLYREAIRRYRSKPRHKFFLPPGRVVNDPFEGQVHA